MKVVRDLDLPRGERRRLIVRVCEVEKSLLFPESIKFALQYLFLKGGKWIEIARIDNYKHDPVKIGSHMHKRGLQEAEFRDISPEEAEGYIVHLGESIIARLMLEGDSNGQN